MARGNRPREQAKSVIERVQKFMSSKDDLIYEFNVVGLHDDFDADTDLTIKMLKALGGGSNSVNVSIEIVAYNATEPTDIISLDEAAWLGREYDADIDTHRNCVNPSVELFFRFPY